MVEVPFGRAILDKVRFLDEDGVVVSLKVEFEWKPLLCKNCNGIGHDTTKCRKPSPPKNPKEGKVKVGKHQWRPKTQQASAKKMSAASAVVTVAPDEGLVTPVERPNQFQVTWRRDGKYHMVEMPARNIIKLSRHEILDKGLSSIKFGNSSFLESLNSATPKVGLFGLLETKFKPLSLNYVRNNICASWCLSTNTQYHKGGRVWILWNPTMFQIQFLEYQAQFIHMRVTNLGSRYCFYLTMVYAFNGVAQRRSLWERLCAFSHCLRGAWIVCGDFNTVLAPSSILGGSSTNEEMDDFRACVDACGLTDSHALGSLYTCSNKQEPMSRVFGRLDRVLVN
ncbi:uncharacterized protein LOC141629264 [Silene latifolia]|uniref:uncharacterized protein LOC141629264 n=1 Tax=Silene latifolia TaxID=37657 RepID=UPI003D78AC9B